MPKPIGNAAEPGEYREVLEFMKSLPAKGANWFSTKQLTEKTGIPYRKLLRRLEKGMFEGYIEQRIGTRSRKDKLARHSANRRLVWRYNQDMPLPGISTKDREKEMKRLANLPKDGVFQPRLLNGERTYQNFPLDPSGAKRAAKSKVRMLRAAFRSRELRKSQWGTTYLVPWIIARGIKPNEWWAKDFIGFVTKILGLGEHVNVKEDREYANFLAAPWLTEKAKSGVKVRVLLISKTGRHSYSMANTIKEIVALPQYQEAVGATKVTRSNGRVGYEGGVTFKAWDEHGQGIVIEGRDAPGMHEPTVQVAGLDTTLTGGHFDLHIWDDVVDQDNVNPNGLKLAIRKFRSYQPLLARGGRSVLMMYGTFYHPMDLYSDIIGKLNHRFDILIDPSLSADDYHVDEDRGEVVIHPQAKSRFESSHPMDFLRQQADTMKEHFVLQYCLDHSKLGSELVKREHLVFTDQIAMPERRATFIVGDFAETEDRRACYTSLLVVQVDPAERFFVRDLAIGQWDIDTVFDAMQSLHRKWPDAKAVASEKNGQTVIYRDSWQRYCTVHGLRLPWHFVEGRNQTNQAKHARIQTLRKPLRSGEIQFDRDLVGRKDFEEVFLPMFFDYGKIPFNDGPDSLTVVYGRDKNENRIVYCSSREPKRDIDDTIHRILNVDMPAAPSAPSPTGVRFGYRRR